MRRVPRNAIASIIVLLTAILLAAGILVPLPAQSPNAGKRPFAFDDLMALKRVGDPVISPDGRWVMFSAVDVDLQANKKTSHLWIVPLAGGDSRQITSHAAGEARGRWSPDGKKLLFVSGRDGSSQIWVSDFDSANGKAFSDPRKITTISTEADGALWFPDGKSILFTSEVYPECNGDDACNKGKDDTHSASKVKAMVFDRLFYRHWNHYTNYKRSHLFVVSAEGGAVRDLTLGDHDVPPFSLGGQDGYAISPDGQEVAFSSNHDEVEAISTNNDIFIVPTAGGTPKKISDSPGSDTAPLYSPDGKFLAWRTQSRGGYESSSIRLAIYDRRSGEIRVPTEGVDRWVESIVWTPDSHHVYFTSEDKGEIPIYRVSERSAVLDRKPGDKPLPVADHYPVAEIARGANDELALTPDGKTLVFTRMSVRAPNEIYKLDIGGKEAVQLTHLNEPVLSQVSMQPVESFWFTGAELAKVQGFLLKPPDFDPQKKYPMKFLIHGGPQGQWGDEWSYRWNAELFAASGYLVVMINPRGSTGYGQDFIDGINGDWGGKPFIDLMRGLDYVEKTYPFVDRDRECALGASYGGYMINWIMGHSNRFKCLVSHDGMFNADSAYGSTEELWFNEWEFKGQPWTNRDTYTKWSPHLYAGQFKTPTLVVHGQLDYRLDVSEGFQLFTTLQRLKIPSKMLYFPDEGHWVLKPLNSQLWYKTVNGWVDSYLKK
jgi:dipeptidyl aminopeptidase/acylaminoacyl peptidase